MLSTGIVERARMYRNVKIHELESVLHIGSYHAKLNNTKGLNTKSFFDFMDALDFYILVIPKEDIDLRELKHCMRLDFEGELKYNTCPRCGHKLSNKEKLYSGCPYCLTPFATMPTIKNDTLPTPYKYVLHAPKDRTEVDNLKVGVHVTLDEKLREDDRKTFDLEDLLNTGEEDVWFTDMLVYLH